MIKLMETTEYDLWLSQLNAPWLFSSPFAGQEFALMLVVADPTITDDDRYDLSKEFVRQGCRYAVCAGDQCSRWDDSIDIAYIESQGASTSDERFVMTTWHEEESLEDIVDFFRLCTAFDDFTPHHYIALILGGDNSVKQAVVSSLNSGFSSQD